MGPNGPRLYDATKAVRSRRGRGTKVGQVVSFRMSDRTRRTRWMSVPGRDRQFTAVPGSRQSPQGSWPAKVSFWRRRRTHAVGHFRSSRRRGNRCASDRFQGFSRHCSTAVQRGSFSKAVAQDLAALVVPMPDKCPQFEQPDSAAATSPAPLKRRCQDKLFACMLRSRISSNPGSRTPRAPPISASTQHRGELLAPMLA